MKQYRKTLWSLVICFTTFFVFHPCIAENVRKLTTLSFTELQKNTKHFNNAFFLMRQFHELKIESQTIHGLSFEKVVLHKPIFKNVIFEDCNLTHTLFMNGEFENVSFKNCRLKESQFKNTVFNNVSFIGGEIEMLRAERDNKEDYVNEMFEQHAFLYVNNKGTLLFDAVRFKEVNIFSLEGGNVILRNMKDFSYHPKYGRMFEGKNTLLRIENTTIAGLEGIAELNAPASIYISESLIQGGEIKAYGRDEKFPNFYAENSQLIKGFQARTFEHLVMKNGMLGGVLEAKNVFLVNSELDKPTQKDTHPEIPKLVGDKIYVLGNGKKAELLYTRSRDELNVFDLSLETLSVSGKINALNLYKLKLDNFHFDSGVELDGGHWEEVEVLSQMKAASPGKYKFKSVEVHEVKLHGGNKIEDARVSKEFSSNENYELETKPGEKSLTPEKIVVPTPETLGMSL